MIEQPNYPVKTVVKALETIEALSKDSNNRGFGVSELSRKLGIGKSTIHRILETLTYFKYVEQNQETGKYKLSWGLFYVGQVVPRQNQLGNIDTQILEELSNRCEETVNVGVRVGKEAVIISKYDKSTHLKAGPEIGGREPAHATSLGKILIHELDQAKLKEVLITETLERFTPNTITKIDDLIKELEIIRQQGFAVDNEEFCLGLTCVAMPIRDYTGTIIAALSVSAPSLRMNESKLMLIKEELTSSCKRISECLGAKTLPK